MNIVCTESVLLAKEVFSTIGNCKIIPTNSQDQNIFRDALTDADALIVRSDAKVSESFIKNTPIKFVGTATSGIDHLDTTYLEKNNIHWYAAHGCNANSVAEYVISALLHISEQKNISFNKKNMAIIGCGHVGCAVMQKAKILGINILMNDPPLHMKKFNQSYLELSKILPEADIISIHTPLTKNLNNQEKWPTYHLANDQFFSQCKKGAIFINTSRGKVCNSNALLSALEKNIISSAIIDVWENEPFFDDGNLGQKVFNKKSGLITITTPHIAGYSYDAKLKGTLMCYKKLCDFFSIQPKYTYNKKMTTYNSDILIDAQKYKNETLLLNNIIKQVYDIETDHNKLINFENTYKKDAFSSAHYFSELRKNYPIRREFHNTTVHVKNGSEKLIETIKYLGFNIS